MPSRGSSAAAGALCRELARLARPGAGLALVCLRTEERAGGALLPVLRELAAPCDTAAALGTKAAVLLMPALGPTGACRVANRALALARERLKRGGPCACAWAILAQPPLSPHDDPASPRGRAACAEDGLRCLTRLVEALRAVPADGTPRRIAVEPQASSRALVGGDEKRFLFSGRRTPRAGM